MMHISPSVRLLLAGALLGVAPSSLLAQRPSAGEAEALLRARPDIAAQLRQRITTSGLTPDQIRSRLRAEGYPESLLDSYLPGGREIETAETSGDVLEAVEALGIAAPYETDELRGAEGDPLARGRAGDPSGGAGALFARSQPEFVWDPNGETIFGVHVFRGPTTQFESNMGGPVDESYRLGPGDRLVLILTGDVELAHTLNVTREGFIVIPQVGQLDVANLTMAQLEDVLYSRLRRVYSGIGRGPNAPTRFSVHVARLRSNQVFVVGDVRRPGSYRVSSAGTVLTALYAAGGPSINGSFRNIEVRRRGKTVGSLDVYSYLLRGDATDDVRLESGDVIFVPVHGPRVRVVGEVIRPATYEVRPGEMVADVIRAAGGFTAQATRRRIQIERIVPPAQRNGSAGHDRIVVDISSEAMGNGSGPQIPIHAGDIVRVFPVSDRVRNRVIVKGNVWSPGPQGFTPGMTVTDALRLAGGVKPDAYLGQVLITRLQPDSTRLQLRASLRDSTGAVVGDFALREDDEISVFSVSEFRPERYVAITGAVRKPGQYPYRDGITMRDLVLLAGGLQESAYLGEAEIARLPENRANGVTASTIRVPLDSSYLFERGPNGEYSGPPGLPANGGEAPELRLQPYDNVLVLQQPDWELQRTVALTGEVRFPGRYALVNKSERLADVIRRAGGLTSEAYAEGVHFFRTSDSTSGRIGIELQSVLKKRDHRDNLLLQDGDSIYIPRYNGIVNVKGAVNSPVAVAYVPGQNIDFYIRAAGGPSRKADVASAYVTQPNGKVEAVHIRPLLPDGKPKPRAGSEVVVPERDPNDRRDYVGLATASAQVLSALVAIVAVLAR